MSIFFLIFMFLLGACLGSFACCQARRLHARENAPKKRSKTPYGRRSICDHCHRQLKWYENIPLLSWLLQKGRCKTCHQKIGLAEPLSELGLALVFLVLGFNFLPKLGLTSASPVLPNFLTSAELILLIIIFTGLTLCFIYDALWGLLPTSVLYLLIIFSLIYLVLTFFTLPVTTRFSLTPDFTTLNLPGLLAAIGILPGVYYLLYLFSKETLVGSGDWLLCLPLVFVLHNFWLTFLVLFLSNFLAVLVNLPLTLAKPKRPHQFPFGPFLILAFWVIFALQGFIF